MSNQPPALLDREARSIHAGLKVILSRDVWSNYREAEFQRKNLRRRYLQLLLLHPNSKEAKDAGTHLWMQTSYAFISLYKQRLARPSNNNNVVETRKLHQRFRQFLAEEERFWQALVLRIQRTYDVGLPSSVPLPPELAGVGIDEEAAIAADAQANADVSRNNQFGFPAASDPSTIIDVPRAISTSVLSKTLICLGDIARYREQFRPPPKFPPHLPEAKKKLYEHKPNYSRARNLYLAAHALAPSEGNAAHQLAILAGYEGDVLASVAWYLRALCVIAPFETAGENLVGVLTRATAHPQAKATIERISAREEQQQLKTDESEPLRVRVEKFKRDLVLLYAVWRDSAGASTTTALTLSTHSARVFASLISARALPEEMIVKVGTVAQGALWVGLHPPPTKSKEEKEDDDDSGKEKRRRSKHKAATVAVLPNPAETQRYLAHLLRLHTAILDVGVRELGEVDVYVGVPPVVTAPIPLPQQQHTPSRRRTRPGRDRERNNANPPPPAPVPAPVPPAVEDHTRSAPSQVKKTELAERITAVFRRTLPALRVGTKWLIANWGLVVREDGAAGAEAEEAIATFWDAYAGFLRLLAKTFPEEELPALTMPKVEAQSDSDEEGERRYARAARAAEDEESDDGKQVERDEAELELEEDLDMRGWLPLKGLMGGHDGDAHPPPTIGMDEGVHPNVEHLMRIRDLLRDGRKIAAMEGSPLTMYGDKFVVKGVEAEKVAVPRSFAQAPSLAALRDSALEADAEPEEDTMTENTADDILHDAFSFLDNPEEQGGAVGIDSDQDEIVWDPRGVPATVAPGPPPAPVPVPAPASPLIVPTARTSPKTPMRPTPISPPSRGSPMVPISASISPQRGAAPPVSPGMQIPATTALDLLNNVLSKSKAAKPLPAPAPNPISTSGESLFFPSGNATQSIWSAARDEPGLMFSSGPQSAGAMVGQSSLQHHQQQQQQQPRHLPPHLPPPGLGYGHQQMHQRFASQDLLSSQSSLWSNSQPQSQPLGSQNYNIPVGPGQQYPVNVNAGVPMSIPPASHQRTVSNSMAAAQLFGGGYGSPLSVHLPPSPAAARYAHVQGPVAPPGFSPLQMHTQAQDSFGAGVFYSSSPPVIAGQYARQHPG